MGHDLRQAVLALGVVLAGLGAIALLTGLIPPALVMGIWGILIVMGIVYERFRYKAVEPTAPGAGWSGTSERFVDPETGQKVRVYVNDAGERRYVQE
ncbi:MAG: hypothetical protein BGN85_10360 [Alphaproteobacteria bacterium 64-11]|nr:hypothetical protein [Alphaproteobacteria bacterium]OJU11041.1 MAG: hypothetical protein BGN85_10360 [Alphaproteobacteria bacterium 64-11]